MAAYATKRPLWQWIVIYLIIGAILYGLVYYFVFARRGGYSVPAPGQTTQQTQPGGY